MFGTKPPERLGTANIQPFRQLPPRLPFLFALLVSSEVCSGCHTRHADAGFCPLSPVRRTDVLVLSFSAFDQSGPGLRWARAAAAERDCAALLREVEELRHQIAELRALAGLRDPTTPLN